MFRTRYYNLTVKKKLYERGEGRDPADKKLYLILFYFVCIYLLI